MNNTQKAGKLHRARARLYRKWFLQPRVRWTTLDEVYTKRNRFAAEIGSKSSSATPAVDRCRASARSCSSVYRALLRKMDVTFGGNFANFWRARYRLFQNEILQQNMRLTAFFKLYKICILLHRCNLKLFAKKTVWKNSNSREILAKKIANVANLAKFCRISKFSA